MNNYDLTLLKLKKEKGDLRYYIKEYLKNPLSLDIQIGLRCFLKESGINKIPKATSNKEKSLKLYNMALNQLCKEKAIRERKEVFIGIEEKEIKAEIDNLNKPIEVKK